MSVASPSAAAPCVGDDNEDGRVSVNELILGVNIALGTMPLATAPSFDADGNGEVGIAEIIAAVGNALGVCASPIPADADLIRGATRLALVDAGALAVMDFGSVGAGNRLQRFRAGLAPQRSDAAAGATACATGEFACSGGLGSRSVQCELQNGRSVLTEVFDACGEGSAEQGGAAVRTGTRIRTVEDADFCTTCSVADDVADTSRLVDFSVDFICEAGCPMGLQNAVVTAQTLELARRPTQGSGETETVVTGDLTVENRRTGERFPQVFASEGLVVTDATAPSGMATVKLNGGVAVDGCLGRLRLATEAPIAFAPEAKCPSDGVLSVTLPGPLDDLGSALTGAPVAPLVDVADQHAGGAAGVAAGTGYRDRAFRALNGAVYQVLQNVDGDPEVGADDFRVTTVAGSAIELFPCQAQPVAPGRPQVAAALGIAPLALERITVSGRIPDASPPCFNPTARGGDGLVCIGPGCEPDTCHCPDAAHCATFTRTDGTPLPAGADDVPPARLLDAATAVSDPRCPQSGYATYGFGAGLPTTAIAECAADPDDNGILLPKLPSDFGADVAGTSVVLAYEVPFGGRFVTGSGALSIDRDGGSACGRDRVTLPIHATQDVSLPPRVAFRPAAVQFNYNADARVDETVASCEDAALLRCKAPGVPTPTPNPECAAIDFGGGELDLGETRFGTTALNRSGGASCGGGGNAAPDFAYLFKAPQDGFYVFDTAGSGFDTVLYVRDRGCTGGELACNDDRDSTSTQSQVALALHAGQRVVVFVDGFAGERGRFSLFVRRTGASAPTPTPPPTAGPIGPTLPDLVVDALSAAPGATTGVVDVSATLTNAGAASGAVAIEFVFSTDAVITGSDTRTRVGCDFASLSAQTGAICAGPLTVPAELSPGLYFVGAIADPANRIEESDESNNAAATGPIAIGMVDPTPTATRPTATASVTPTIGTPTATRSATITPPVATTTTTPTPPLPTGTASTTPTITTPTPGPPTATGTRTRTPTRTGTVTPTRTPSSTPTGPMNIVFARPVGVSVRAVPSAGQVVIAPATEQTVTVTLLAAPAAVDLDVTVTSSDAAVASVIGSPTIATGTRTVGLTIHTGIAGTATLRIRGGGEVRDLLIVVGQPAPASAPLFAAPIVGASLRNAPSAGTVLLGPGQQRSITVTLLSAPAPAALTVAVSSSNTAVASLAGAVVVALGARTAAIPIQAGIAGAASLRLRAGTEVHDLHVYVGTPPAGSLPAVTAPVVGLAKQ